MSRLTTNDTPQSSRLHEIIVRDMAGVVRDFTDPFLVFRVQGQRLGLDAFDLWVELGRLKRGVDVVWIAAVIAVESHLAISLEGRVYLDLGCVGWELLVVYAEAVPCCVGVGE